MSTVSHDTAVSDPPVTNGHAVSAKSAAPGYHTDLGKESALKPLNSSTSSTNLDSSVQLIIEKMHSGLEVCFFLLVLKSNTRYTHIKKT